MATAHVLPKQQPSPQQQAVYDWVINGRGNVTLIAVAGSGKTTTLINACEHMNGSVAMVAYNKKIADEFSTKLANRGFKHVRGGTAHSFGLNAWAYACKWTPAQRSQAIDPKAKWDAVVTNCMIPVQYQAFVKSLLSLAKQRAIGALCPINDLSKWNDIVDHFDLAYELADEEHPEQDLDAMVEQGVQFAIDALRVSISMARTLIDYDDMIYMPLQANCRMWQNDWLLVDEAQDTNPARRALYKKMLRPGGRAIFVGDPAQAIYGFTGADNDSLELIQKEFNAKQMNLTVTFRCPKAVVALAQTWVNHIQSAPTSAAGLVKTVTNEEFKKSFASLRKTDAILCRNTKPLVELAFALIRAGVPCHVEGKAIGEGLIALAKKWKVVSIDSLKNRLEKYQEREVTKLMAKGKEQSAEAIADKVATLVVIIDSLPAGSKVVDLQNHIGKMFSDTREGQPADNLTLSTVHKSKGREWHTVYLLGRNKFMPSVFARQAWQMQQENNLCYVAVTRAMNTLVEITV